MRHPTQGSRTILHGFSTFKLGGPQARFAQLVKTMGNSYHHIIAAMDNNFEAAERLPVDGSWELLEIPVQKGRTLVNRTVLRAELRRVKPDLLLSYNWGAIEWAAANSPQLVPQIHIEDGFGPEEALAQLRRRVWLRRLLLGIKRVPVVVASRQLENIALHVWKLPSQKVHFLPNGVSIPTTEERERRSSLPNPKCLVIGTVAALRREKNLARLIRAFALLRERQEAKLVIVGDGPERANLERQSHDLGISSSIEFTGYLSDPSKQLARFDLFALSSDTEQLPIAMLEAMAWSVPVVATRVGDVPSILGDIAPQMLADVNDASFEQVLLAAVEQRAQWPKWATKGRERIGKHYSQEKMNSAWKAVFDGHTEPQKPLITEKG